MGNLEGHVEKQREELQNRGADTSCRRGVSLFLATGGGKLGDGREGNVVFIMTNMSKQLCSFQKRGVGTWISTGKAPHFNPFILEWRIFGGYLVENDSK